MRYFALAPSCFVLMIHLLTSKAFAGGETQNGGDAVVCFAENGKIESVVSHDVFESEIQIPNFAIRMGREEDEEYSKAALALGSLKSLDEVRYRRYLGRLNNAKFHFTPMSLVDINDSNHVRAIEAPCKLMQLAIHQWVPGNFTNEFLVNQELWNFMNRDHKAALLLHEIVYEDFFKELEERDSANAKRFVGLLVSGSLLNISAVEYNEMLRAMGLGKLRTDLLPMIAERRFSSRSTNSDSVLESMSLKIEDHSAENYHFITFAPQRFQLIEGQLPPGCRIDRILFHKQGSKGNFEWDLKCHSISRESMVRFLSKDIEIHLFTGIETLSLKIAR